MGIVGEHMGMKPRNPRQGFRFRLNAGRRDRELARAIDYMIEVDGIDASQWAKDVLYAAATGGQTPGEMFAQIMPLLERIAATLEGNGDRPAAPKDIQAAQVLLDSLGDSFK